MEKKKIIFLTMGEFLHDPRVYRNAISSRRQGHTIQVVSFTPNPFQEYSADGIPVLNISVYESIPPIIRDAIIAINSKYRIEYIYGYSQKSENRERIRILTQFFTQIAHFFFFMVYSNVYLYMKIRKIEGDIYYANNLPTLLAALLIARHHHAKTLYDVRELWSDINEKTLSALRKIMNWYEKVLIHRVHATITVNKSIADIIQKRYRVSQPLVVYNCPELQEGDINPKNGHIRIIYQGRYVKNRGLENTILSAKYLHEGKIYFRGLEDFGGGYSYRNYLEDIVKKNNLADKVIFINPVDMKDLVISLNEYDIGIVPYQPVTLNHKYATGLKIFEYMMAGCAVAASDLPELSKIVTECNNGVLMNPYSPEDIGMKLNQLIDDKNFLELCKKNSQRCSNLVYNWDIQAKKLNALYDSL